MGPLNVSGGPSVTLCDTPDYRGGTWSRDGVIVFASGSTSGLQKVPASGGVPGVLVYQTGTGSQGRQLTWFDLMGRLQGPVGDRATYDDVVLSPDGTRAAVSIVDPRLRTSDIWIVDLARGLRTRFTFDPSDEAAPVWSPDGDSIVFGSRSKGRMDLYQKASSGAGTEALLLADMVDKCPQSWSSDGRFIIYWAAQDVWALPLSGDRKPFPLLRTQFNEQFPQLSPDGRWLAYTSNESGRNEVYVTSFPGPGGKWQVSARGGSFSRWRRDGVFFGGGGALSAAAVNGRGSAFEVGAVRSLSLGGTLRVTGARTAYDVSPDGRRLLAATLGEGAAAMSLTVVTNWTESLNK